MTPRLMLLLALAFGFALAPATRFATAEDIVIDTSMSVETHRVFGPEHPGIYKHPASITELDNGDLLRWIAIALFVLASFFGTTLS